jgi:hypothetical protein
MTQATAGSASAAAAKVRKPYRIQVHNIEACNCNHGCNCQFGVATYSTPTWSNQQ